MDEQDREAHVPDGRTKKKKLGKGGLTAIIAGSLVMAIILGAFGFVYFKLKAMSRNATGTVPKPTVNPVTQVTAPPSDLVIIDGEPEDLTQDYDAPIDPSDIYADPIYQEDQIDPDVLNILLLGDDGRDSYDSGRSDVMLLLSYNKRLNTIKMISLLRDTWIYIPGRDTWNRINTAYRFGGVGLAINTVNTNFQLDVQYYALIHFRDIVEITDYLGGIDIELTAKEAELINARSGSPNTLPEVSGMHHLDGLQTFAHARNRSIGNGDWSRTERQRQILSAFFEKAKQQESATALAELVFNLMGYVETNMSPTQILSIATSVVFSEKSVTPETATIPCPGSWTYAYEGRMAVIHINLEENVRWLREFLYGTEDDAGSE